MDEQTRDLLREAAAEIRSLRRANELLAARNEVIDIIGAIVLPRQTQGMTEDVAWKIDQKLAAIKDRI